MKNVRNNFGFHYNPDDEGQLTNEAINRAAKRENRVGIIHTSSDPQRIHFRFSLADEVLFEAWVKELGVDTSDPKAAREQIVHTKEFIKKVGAAFIEFADQLVPVWIGSNGLAIR